MDESEEDLILFGSADDAEEALLRECRLGNVATVKQLLEARAASRVALDINCKGKSKHFLDQTALHLATYFGHSRVVNLLLEHGADINAVNQCGDTPLHKAAYIGNEELVLLLLERGASVSVVNGAGQLAAAVSADPYIGSLLRATAGTERRLQQQRLLRASSDGDTKTIDSMLKEPHPPNINCTDGQGNTCLHVAAYRGHKAAAILLLENGIDTTIVNASGQLAVDLAQQDQMRQVLGVTPVRRLQRSAVRCEGPLVRRHRFTGWKPVWAVLERGVLTYFNSRGDASSGVKRKDFKYLDGARVSVAETADPATLSLHFNDGTLHRLRCDDGDDRVSRQKWMNALQEHIDFSSHYIRHGLDLDDSDEEALKPLGSMQDAMQSAKAQEHLLRQHLQEISFVASALHPPESVPHSLALVDKLRATGECAKDMVSSLSHCLALFIQQEEVRQLQLRQERERCRVLEQSLHVLATEQLQLEQSLQRSLSGPPTELDQHCVTSEDEFFDADGTDTSDDDFTLTSCTTPSCSTPATLSGGESCSVPLPAGLAGGGQVTAHAQSVSSLASSDTVVSSQGGRYRRPRARLPAARRPPPAYGRTRLPKEQTTSDNFSIWSVLKSAIGKELTKIPMPVVFNEPLSFLQRMAEFMEYSHLLQRAAEQPDSISRMQYVAAFAVSGLASNWERVGKPFNPLLGETFELHRSGFRMVCEQVSHHPPVSAFHAESESFRFHGSIQPKLKFWGRSVEIQPRGLLTVELPGHDEVFTWSNVNCCVHNIIVGKLWIEQYGTMDITNQRTGDRCTIFFKPAGWFSKELHRLEGFITDKSRQTPSQILATFSFPYKYLPGKPKQTRVAPAPRSEGGSGNNNPSNGLAPSAGRQGSKHQLDHLRQKGHRPVSKTRHRFLYGKWTDFLRSTDIQAYEDYERVHAGKFRADSDGDAGPTHSPAHRSRRMLSKLNSITASTFRAHADKEVVSESELEPDGEVPRCSSVYSIDIPNSVTLWQADARPADSNKYYHFTAFAMSLNQRGDETHLCCTDCRLRPDIRALEEGSIDLAALEKNRLEEKQRAARQLRNKRGGVWQARHFKRCSNPHVKADDWLFTGSYWETRDSATLDIF